MVVQSWVATKLSMNKLCSKIELLEYVPHIYRLRRYASSSHAYEENLAPRN